MSRYVLDDCGDTEPVITAGELLRTSMLKLTTGIDVVDRAVELKVGQFAVFEGEASESFLFLLSVRAALPKPVGLDTDVVFIDGGNVFDPYAITEHSLSHEARPEEILKRIHISRAFTYHQLNTLITEKLPRAIDKFRARLVVISDITQLYCDPDVEDKQEALDIFRRNMKALAITATRKYTLIIATNQHTRNKKMNDALLQTAHISASLEEKDTFMRLTLHRHPLTPQREVTAWSNKETLERYL